MYQIIDDNNELLINSFFKTKREAKEAIKWNFSCLKRDGFLNDYTFKEYFQECCIEKRKEK